MPYGILVGLCNLSDDFLVRKYRGMILLIKSFESSEDLALFESSSSDCRKDGTPVLITILDRNILLVFGRHNAVDIHAPCLGKVQKHFFSLGYVIVLGYALEPLVYLILGLRALDYVEPVGTGTLDIRTCDDLDTVAVLDPVIDGNKLTVDPRTDHAVSYRGVYAVCEIYRA